jgi:hypothetical protein
MDTIEPKIVFMFGAGASYGSGGLYRKPPLGGDLFDVLVKVYSSTWGSLVSKYGALFHENFEQGMEKCLRDSTVDHTRLLIDMANYFSKYRIAKPRENLYVQLFTRYKKEIESGDILVSTINYECLIEFAFRVAHIEGKYWDPGKGAYILKLHGSCNFFFNFEAWPETGRQHVKIPLDSLANGTLCNIPPWDVPDCLEATGLIPAMSEYAPGKPTNTGPQTINQIRKLYSDAVLSSRKVIIVGARPDTQDDHLWRPIKGMEGGSAFVCGRPEFDRASWTDKSEYLGDHFDTSYSSILNVVDKALS